MFTLLVLRLLLSCTLWLFKFCATWIAVLILIATSLLTRSDLVCEGSIVCSRQLWSRTWMDPSICTYLAVFTGHYCITSGQSSCDIWSLTGRFCLFCLDGANIFLQETQVHHFLSPSGCLIIHDGKLCFNIQNGYTLDTQNCLSSNLNYVNWYQMWKFEWGSLMGIKSVVIVIYLAKKGEDCDGHSHHIKCHRKLVLEIGRYYTQITTNRLPQTLLWNL